MAFNGKSYITLKLLNLNEVPIFDLPEIFQISKITEIMEASLDA